MMGVFNNLVMYKQDEPQNSMQSIVPDLATSWSWSEDGTELTFKLRQGVKWHDGKPFTAADVKCTCDLLLGKAKEKLRINPRKAWYRNLDEVTANGDDEATFHLQRPQPAFITLARLRLFADLSLPCVAARDAHPPDRHRALQICRVQSRTSGSRSTRNPDYWKPGRPYLDGIEYTIIPNRSTAILAFVAGKFDMTWPYIITVAAAEGHQEPGAAGDLRTDARQTAAPICSSTATKPPFDNADLRRAMALTFDRKAFIDILSDGQGEDRRRDAAAARRVVGHAAGAAADIARLRPRRAEEPRRSPQDHGKARLRAGQAAARSRYRRATSPAYRDPAVILIDQLKEIYIDGELDTIETANWHAKVTRKDYSVALNGTGSGVDDPDQQFYENYACGSDRNYSGYCNPELDKEFDRQSMEPDQEKRKKLVWEIDRKLQEDGARPIISHNLAATCWQPQVKGLTMMVNSIYNGWRFEDVWLDQ